MDLIEYQINAKRTCPSLGSDKLDLSHMVLGLHSELAELGTAYAKEDRINMKEELGDHYWYLANYCTFRKYDLHDISKHNFISDSYPVEYYTSNLQDLVKKYIAYNKEINEIEERKLLWEILRYFKGYMESFDIELSEVLQSNIDKLKTRFPKEFTEEKALNRDLDAERQSLH